MKKHEIVHELIKLIEDPAHWTQNVYARNAEGHVVNPWDLDAHCFCSLGAMERVESDKSRNPSTVFAHPAYLDIRGKFNELTNDSVVRFNDTHTHAQVIDVWRRVEQAFKETDE